jgi:arylsulfatase
LESEKPQGHRVLFFEHVGGAAHRDGDWKIVRRNGQPWSLFDLSKDRTETNDVAKHHPDRVTAMARAWNGWWEEMTGEKPRRTSAKPRSRRRDEEP